MLALSPRVDSVAFPLATRLSRATTSPRAAPRHVLRCALSRVAYRVALTSRYSVWICGELSSVRTRLSRLGFQTQPRPLPRLRPSLGLDLLTLLAGLVVA